MSEVMLDEFHLLLFTPTGQSEEAEAARRVVNSRWFRRRLVRAFRRLLRGREQTRNVVVRLTR